MHKSWTICNNLQHTYWVTRTSWPKQWRNNKANRQHNNFLKQSRVLRRIRWKLVVIHCPKKLTSPRGPRRIISLDRIEIGTILQCSRINIIQCNNNPMIVDRHLTLLNSRTREWPSISERVAARSTHISTKCKFKTKMANHKWHNSNWTVTRWRSTIKPDMLVSLKQRRRSNRTNHRSFKSISCLQVHQSPAKLRIHRARRKYRRWIRWRCWYKNNRTCWISHRWIKRRNQRYSLMIWRIRLCSIITYRKISSISWISSSKWNNLKGLAISKRALLCTKGVWLRSLLRGCWETRVRTSAPPGRRWIRQIKTTAIRMLRAVTSRYWTYLILNNYREIYPMLILETKQSSTRTRPKIKTSARTCLRVPRSRGQGRRIRTRTK